MAAPAGAPALSAESEYLAKMKVGRAGAGADARNGQRTVRFRWLNTDLRQRFARQANRTRQSGASDDGI
ncbi:hypothetical protein SAMN04490248_10653 [Salinihabitans flavidus]|uniref:Uncharacterized protein n=1 Tax=Salinihabitans flavidus TaxID=569882 RepID=A0A1H8Q854_9RHOB|nr:hypothetical protein SAMN04490248_10653 [Salinihabitans flavidus]